MHTYRVNVTRDGRWWMVDVPELAGFAYQGGGVNTSTLTQARRLSEVEDMAMDFISCVTDADRSQIAVDVTVKIDGIDVTSAARQVFEERRLAEEHAAAAAAQGKQLARDLAAHGVAVRDVGEVLGVSFQRAQQLITT